MESMPFVLSGPRIIPNFWGGQYAGSARSPGLDPSGGTKIHREAGVVKGANAGRPRPTRLFPRPERVSPLWVERRKATAENPAFPFSPSDFDEARCINFIYTTRGGWKTLERHSMPGPGAFRWTYCPPMRRDLWTERFEENGRQETSECSIAKRITAVVKKGWKGF